MVSCSDPICTNLAPTTSSQCSAETNRCGYSFQYGDGSGTSGFYVSDMFYFDMILGNSMVVNSSASIVFGCALISCLNLFVICKIFVEDIMS